MTRLPDRMTDAAYQKHYRDAEKHFEQVREEHVRAQSAWESSSVATCGIRGHVANWLHVHQVSRRLKKKRDELLLLKGFKRIHGKN